MFNFDWSEIALIGVVALVLIGPKDMPVAIRAISEALKRMRRMAGELQGHVDEMVRDADLGEARDAFRDIRSMNIRSQVMRTIDADGALQRTLKEKPFSGDSLLGRRPGGGASTVMTGNPLGDALAQQAARSAALPGVGPGDPVSGGADLGSGGAMPPEHETRAPDALTTRRDDAAPAFIPPRRIPVPAAIVAAGGVSHPPAFIPPRVPNVPASASEALPASPPLPADAMPDEGEIAVGTAIRPEAEPAVDAVATERS